MKPTDIPPKVRAKVYERDSFDGVPCCIFCGSPYNLSCAHFIGRGRGGLGIEENLGMACFQCHTELDNGKDGDILHQAFEDYLKSKYPSWDRGKLIDNIDPAWRFDNTVR